MNPMDAIMAEITEAAKTMTEPEFDEFMNDLKDNLAEISWDDLNGDGDE